jgi:hypothetical protein
MFLSKGLQRKLWRFCEISKGYKEKKPKVSTSKFFRRARFFWATLQPPSRSIPPMGSRADGRLWAFVSQQGAGVFMAEEPSGKREFST